MPVSAVISVRPAVVYDAEYHIGLQPNDSSLSVATDNATRLNTALAAMWNGGYFEFEKGAPGPVSRPIMFGPSEYFFQGPIKTSPRIGGALLGVNSSAFAAPTSDYLTDGTSGGMVSRLTRIDGENGGPVIRLRGYGFTLDGLDIKGRTWTSDAVYGASPADACIEVEGRSTPASGGHVIRNCALSGANYGISVLAGYYNDLGSLVPDETNASRGSVDCVNFSEVASCFRCSNEKAVGWNFRNIWVRKAITSTAELVVFDLVRGGYVLVQGLQLDHNKATLFKVQDYSRYCQLLDCCGFRWSEYNAVDDFLTLFQYAGSSTAAESLKWTVRVTGGIDNTEDEPTYDTTKLIQVASAAADFPFDDLMFDVARMPQNGFQRSDTWLIPTEILMS